MKIVAFCLLLIRFKIARSEPTNQTNNGVYIRIYDNIAEISRSISPSDLPIMFSEQEWKDIRSDSLRLLSDCSSVHAQIISFNQTSLNGQKILIKRNANNDTFTEGIMIDERRNLVRDLVDNTYYILTDDRIRYFSIPYQRNYSVDFVIETSNNEQIYIRYLQKNIKWTVRYDLLLENNETTAILQGYADIRNEGNSLLKIDLAELISGDISLQTSSPSNNPNGGDSFYDAAGSGSGSAPQDTVSPSISAAEELIGVYIFTINETFILRPRSNHILPVFCPNIDIERYGSIEKYFSPIDNRGNAQRAYRVRVEETFLPEGQAFVRESDRLVGEVFWSDLAANETNEFNLGEDPDLQYIEYIQLNSRRQAQRNNNYRPTISTYTVDLYLINGKSRSINFEYRLKFFTQNNLVLKGNLTNNLFQLDGSAIFGIFPINANDEQQFTFTFETE